MDAFAWYLTGALAYRSAQWQEAIEALTTAVRLTSEQRLQLLGHERLYLAMAYWQVGRRDEARALYSQTATDDHEIRQLYEDNSLLHAEAAALIQADTTTSHKVPAPLPLEKGPSR